MNGLFRLKEEFEIEKASMMKALDARMSGIEAKYQSEFAAFREKAETLENRTVVSHEELDRLRNQLRMIQIRTRKEQRCPNFITPASRPIERVRSAQQRTNAASSFQLSPWDIGLVNYQTLFGSAKCEGKDEFIDPDSV